MSTVTDELHEIGARVLDELRAIGRVLDDDWPPARPLELDSLGVILLHERLEASFGIRIRADEVSEESFATVESLAALVAHALADGRGAR